MSPTILIDKDTGHQIIYDPYSLDDSINGYETCRRIIDEDKKMKKIDSETHMNLVFLLNTARTKALRSQIQDNIDITLLLSD